jgi:hypothetical protein
MNVALLSFLRDEEEKGEEENEEDGTNWLRWYAGWEC